LGVFEFVLLIVLITTIGKVIEARSTDSKAGKALPPASPDVQHLEEMLGDMNGRLARLEEERDFYRALLEPPAGERLPVPDATNRDRD
jgi:hypothetical protein